MFPIREWIDVARGAVPPANAGKINAAFMEALEAWGVSIDGLQPNKADLVEGKLRLDQVPSGISASPLEDIIPPGVYAAEGYPDPPAIPIPASLDVTLPSFPLFANGKKLVAPSLTRTYEASKITCIDVNLDGTLSVKVMVDGSYPPYPDGVNQFRVWELRTDATGITGIFFDGGITMQYHSGVKQADGSSAPGSLIARISNGFPARIRGFLPFSTSDGLWVNTASEYNAPAFAKIGPGLHERQTDPDYSPPLEGYAWQRTDLVPREVKMFVGAGVVTIFPAREQDFDVRIDDPLAPREGQRWIRSDLAPPQLRVRVGLTTYQTPFTAVP